VLPTGTQSVTFSLVSDATSTKVELCAAAYLLKLGLTLKEGDKVTITGWQHKTKDGGSALIARDVTIDGKTYTLRNDAKKGVWEPKYEAATLDGTVKDLTQTTAATGEKGKGKGQEVEVAFTLVSDAVQTKITLAPAPYLTQIGLTLKEGDKVSINGWKRTVFDDISFVVRSITLDGKTYVLRDDKLHAAWAAKTQITTLQGTVKNLIQPTATGKHQQHADISFTLTDANNVTVKTILGPAKDIAQLGITLKEGDTVSVTGLQTTTYDNLSSLVAYTITVNGTAYTLRDPKGKVVWAKSKTITPATTPPATTPAATK